jgi:hypothetical protein
MNVKTRIEKLEKKQRGTHVPQDQEARLRRGMDLLLGKTPRHEEQIHPRDEEAQLRGEAYRFFLDICKSGELEREAARRGITVEDEGAA